MNEYQQRWVFNIAMVFFLNSVVQTFFWPGFVMFFLSDLYLIILTVAFLVTDPELKHA